MNNLDSQYKIIEDIYKTPLSRIVTAKKYKNKNTDELDGKLFVIKEYLDDDNAAINIEKEKSLTQLIDNATKTGIVVPVFETLDNRYLIMEFKKHGMFLSSLIDYCIENEKNLPLMLASYITLHILESLDILHNCLNSKEDKKGYLHMDVHPGNIFIENMDVTLLDGVSIKSDLEKLQVKFIDLQSAVITNKEGYGKRESTDYQFTEIYSAPEKCNYQNELFEESCDLYSVAVILLRLMTLCKDEGVQSVREILSQTIDIETSGSPMYRYKSADKMIEIIKEAIKLIESIMKPDYVKVSDISYYLNIDEAYINEDAKTISFNLERYGEAVKELADRLLAFRPDQEKSLYLYNLLNIIYESKHTEYDKMEALRPKLLASGISCYNNIGLTKEAAAIADEYIMLRQKGSLLIDEFLEGINRVPEIYYDLHELDKAIKLQENNKDILEDIYLKDKNLAEKWNFSVNPKSVKAYGRSLSAYGRYLSVSDSEKDVDMGIMYLKKALDVFDEISDEGNKKITTSTILYVAAESDNKGLFDEYAYEYFGLVSEEGEKTENLLIKHFVDDNHDYTKNYEDYTILATLKCLKAFGLSVLLNGNMNEFRDRVVEKLLSIEKMISKREKVNYPVNLIYKYLGLIYFELNGRMYDETVSRIMNKSLNDDGSFIIKRYEQLNPVTIMSYQIKWLINTIQKNDKANEKLFELFLEHSGDSSLGLLAYHKLALEQRTLDNLIKLT